MKQYRARGIYIARNKDNKTESWVTTVWRKTREEVEDDIELYAKDRYKEDSLEIIERDGDEKWKS